MTHIRSEEYFAHITNKQNSSHIFLPRVYLNDADAHHFLLARFSLCDWIYLSLRVQGIFFGMHSSSCLAIRFCIYILLLLYMEVCCRLMNYYLKAILSPQFIHLLFWLFWFCNVLVIREKTKPKKVHLYVLICKLEHRNVRRVCMYVYGHRTHRGQSAFSPG